MRLYELTADFKALESAVESGDITAELVADTLEGIELGIEKKVEACLMVQRQCLAEADAYKAEAERLIKLSHDAQNSADRLIEYVRFNMLAIGRDKLDAGLFKLTLKKAAKKLGDIDESKVPEKYFIEVPATKKLDKRLLLSAAKLTEIEGVQLVDSDRALMVK